MEKTRLIEFGRFAAPNREQRGEGKPETFTFLGFTHYCGKRRGNGAFIVWRKTAKKRMIAKLRVIKAELRFRMHEPVALVGAWLQKVVVGYYQYHAVPGNLDRLRIFGQRLRQAVALGTKSSQSMRHVALGSVNSDLQPLDSYRACSASLSNGTLHRHSSKVGAVCVNALVRFCAGGDQ